MLEGYSLELALGTGNEEVECVLGLHVVRRADCEWSEGGVCKAA